MELPKEGRVLIIWAKDGDEYDEEEYIFSGYYSDGIWMALFPDDPPDVLVELHIPVVRWRYLKGMGL